MMVRLAAGLVLSAALLGCGDDEAALRKVKDEVCACPDRACAATAMKKIEKPTGTPSAQAKKLAQELLRCLARLDEPTLP